MSAPAQRRSGSDPSCRHLINIPLTQRFLSWIHVPELGGCYELRAPHARIHYRTNAIVAADSIHATVGGWYDDVSESRNDLSRVEDVSIYACFNPIDHDLCGRKKNRIGAITRATKDEHIIKWVRFYLDFDSVRIEGISATDDELARTLDQFHFMLDAEPELAAAAHWGCSGNGAWGGADFVPLDLATAEPLVEHALLYIAARYSLPGVVKIGTECKNSSRIGCVPGTWKCKGEDLPGDRPWRQVTMDSTDEPRTPLVLPDWLADRPLPEIAPDGRGRPRRGRVAVPSPNGNGAHVDEVLPPPPSPPSGGAARSDLADRVRRATAYVARIEPAVSGDGGHSQTFHVACVLVKGFDLTPDEAYPIIAAWNQTCESSDRWTDSDLWYKLREADEKGDDKPRGYLYEASSRQALPDRGQFMGEGFETKAEPEAKDGVSGNVPSPKGNTPAPAKYPRLPKTEVTVSPVEIFVNDQVSNELYRFPGLYQKNLMLSEVVKEDPGQNKIKWLQVPAGTPMIMPVGPGRLRDIISGIVTFKQKVADQATLKVVHVPGWCVTGVGSRHTWPRVKRLVGIVEHPILRPDGSISERPGYDQDTGMLWIGDPIDPVPECPTQQDAIDAAAKILDLVSEFEFEDDVSKAVWLSCLLTILGRHLINGTVPLFYFDASTAGAGKSLLCDVISCIVTGREMTRTEYHHDSVEMGKRIVATLLMGMRVTMLDNIEGDFGNSALDNVLTARYYSGRILGLSRMSPPLLVDTVFVATSNNAVLCGDLYRRIITSRLVSSCERPDQDRIDFKIGCLEDYAREHRPELLCCALTILRAYILAKVDHGLPTNVYGDWTRLIRGSVKWCTGFDPWKHRAKSVNSDSKRMGNALFLDSFAKMLTRQGMTSMTAHEILDELQGEFGPIRNKDMHEAVMSLCNCRNGNLPTPGILGGRMGRLNKTRYGNLCLVKTDDPHAKKALWSVHEFTVDGDDGAQTSVEARDAASEVCGTLRVSAGTLPIQDPPDVEDGGYTTED